MDGWGALLKCFAKSTTGGESAVPEYTRVGIGVSPQRDMR